MHRSALLALLCLPLMSQVCSYHMKWHKYYHAESVYSAQLAARNLTPSVACAADPALYYVGSRVQAIDFTFGLDSVPEWLNGDPYGISRAKMELRLWDTYTGDTWFYASYVGANTWDYFFSGGWYIADPTSGLHFFYLQPFDWATANFYTIEIDYWTGSSWCPTRYDGVVLQEPGGNAPPQHLAYLPQSSVSDYLDPCEWPFDYPNCYNYVDSSGDVICSCGYLQ